MYVYICRCVRVHICISYKHTHKPTYIYIHLSNLSIHCYSFCFYIQYHGGIKDITTMSVKTFCFILCSVLLTSWRNIRLLHHIRTYNTKKDPIWTASLCIPLRGHSTLWKFNWEMNKKLKKINLSFLFAFYLILKENVIRSTFNHNCYFNRSNYNLFSSIFNILKNAQ